ncbi:MAG: hypothetical protein S4CHLAM6_08750 [Chlamydiae bacterium]|nr:hypothetical protein [Chlamydiota bacterium]
MSIEPHLKTTLSPCFELARLAHKKLSPKSFTPHRTLSALVNILTYEEEKPSLNVGVAALAEDVYNFFTKELYQSMSLTSLMEQTESDRLFVKHELINHNSSIPTNKVVQILENFDRHISVLKELSMITRAYAVSKIVVGCVITSGAAYGLANSSLVPSTALGLIYSIPTAVYSLSKGVQLSAMDYTPTTCWGEEKPSIRERLLTNYYSITKLDIGFQKLPLQLSGIHEPIV